MNFSEDHRRPDLSQEHAHAETRFVPIETVISAISMEGLLVNEAIPALHHKIEFALGRERTQGVASPSQYVEQFVQEGRESRELQASLERVRGQVLVDLGAGMFGSGYEIACTLGAHAYVAVDKFFADRAFEHLTQTADEHPHPVPFVVAQEDLLDFLKRLPDRSVSVLCSALQRPVINDPTYIDAVNREISRVVHVKGAYVNYGDSVFRPDDLTSEQYDLSLEPLEVYTP